MAPAVILIGCLLATMSCLTTAVSSPAPTTSSTSSPTTTTVHPPAYPPLGPTADPPFITTAATTKAFKTTTTAPPLDPTADPPFITSTTATTKAFKTTTAPPLCPTVDPPFITTKATTKVTGVTSNSSGATAISVTTRPGVTTATTTTTTQTPANGSCANPNLCCTGFNSYCHRSNCYCDVACLRFGDCCHDFKHTCLAVNNSSNGTEPNNTLTLTGTCSEPTLCCSGVNYDCFRGCFCDQACKQLNDCCPDLNSTCIFNTTTAAPPFNTTINPPFSSTINPPFSTTATSPKDVLTFLTNLDVEVLAEESSTEEERQAALRQVGALLESLLRAYNPDIYSFEVTRIEPVSSSSSSSTPCD
ncbi:hypothetical protein R3I93_013258 [Phoxinus phoxinus]|uniref:SMB domain-containing protein n=1 Tax=Phoxinus phoxinus TaxID=58324 RepID=A0AAN9CRJ9_9TELE